MWTIGTTLRRLPHESDQKCVGCVGYVLGSFSQPNTISSLLFRGSPPVVLGVLGLASRTRMCVIIFNQRTYGTHLFSHARTVKPNTPNTLNTFDLKLLNLKGFRCVGFVLGMAFFVSGWVLSVGAGR